MKTLKPRHKMFVYYYFKTNFNGAKSAILAGYSPKCARQTAWRIINKT